MKKIIIGICAVIIVLGILGWIYIINPLNFRTEEVKDIKTESDFLIMLNNKQNDNYKSDNINDYRKAHIDIDYTYKSIFDLNSLAQVKVKYDDKYKDRVIYTSKKAANVTEDIESQKHLSGGMALDVWLYVGDVENEDEIMDMVYEFANSCEIEYSYDMQVLGTRSKKYKVKVDKDMLDYSDEDDC